MALKFLNCCSKGGGQQKPLGFETEEPERKPLVQEFQLADNDRTPSARVMKTTNGPTPPLVYLGRICCGLSVCVGVLLVLVIVVLSMVLGSGLWSAVLGFVQCWFGTCINVFRLFNGCNDCNRGALKQLFSVPIGGYGVPVGYLTQTGGGPGFTLYNQTQIADFETAAKMQAAMPEKLWSGEWTRGSELGFAVQSPILWDVLDLWPPAIGLDSIPSQAGVARPYLDEAFSFDTDVHEFVVTSLKQFLKDRKEAGKLQVPRDLRIWAHQVLYYKMFGKTPTWEEATAFVELQRSMVNLGTLTAAMPSWLFGKLGPAVQPTVDGKLAFVRKMMRDVEKKWGDKLAKQDCSPSPNCTIQVTSALFDGLYAAGGLSTPDSIMTGLGLMYSTDSSNPASGPFDVPHGKELEFYYECLRLFAPVYGVPVFTHRPTCPGLTDEETQKLQKLGGQSQACPRTEYDSAYLSHKVNIWLGGSRQIINLAYVGLDKKAWGEDSNQFVLRGLKTYEKNFIGFNDKAVDPSVAGGRSDRICPGKRLALDIGATFFAVFERSAWKATNPDGITMNPLAANQQVSPFTLVPADAPGRRLRQGAEAANSP